MNSKGKLAFLVVVLVLVPLFSWLFLKQGFNYRMDALTELKDMTSFDSKKVLPSVELEEKITLLATSLVSEKDIRLLYEQFGAVKEFQLIHIGTDADYKELGDNIRSVTESEIDGAAYNEVFPTSTIYALIDEKTNIRKIYESENERGDMVKHISTLLPFVEKKTR